MQQNILLCHDDRGPRDVPGSTKVKVIDFGGGKFFLCYDLLKSYMQADT